MSVSVGILALQGSVEPHFRHLEAIGASASLVRTCHQLEAITHLIIPGGESTTLWRLLSLGRMWEVLAARGIDRSLALMGTCAGAILLGRDPGNDPPPRLGLIDIPVSRNAYGRQIDSFSAPVEVAEPFGSGEIEGVFIRAPRFGMPGPGVEEVASMSGTGVAFHHGRCLVTSFHPELTEDLQLHRAFLKI